MKQVIARYKCDINYCTNFHERWFILKNTLHENNIFLVLYKKKINFNE